MISAVFHYLGPSLAVLLFASVDVLGVAWLRIASGGLVFALWRRPGVGRPSCGGIALVTAGVAVHDVRT